MNDFILALHSGVRWLVVLATLAALIKLGLGIVQKQTFDNLARRIMLVFTILMDVQWLIGLIVFLALNSFSVGYRWEHAVTMTLALVAAHLPARWKKADDATRYRANLIAVIAVLVFVFIGIARLPQGWSMS